MATNPNSLARQRETLYEQIRSASRQQAQQSYQTGLSSLRQQLQQQRLNMNQSRGQISEQAAMTQRGIQGQAQARGLGSSGLTNLASFQAQQQAGKAVSGLEQQNQMVQSEAMNARRGLMNELSQATRGADLAYGQQMAESGERQFQQEQSMRDSNVNFMSTLAELSATGQGSLAKQLADMYYGGGLDTSPEGLANFIKEADPENQYDPIEHEQLKSGYSQNGGNQFWNWVTNWVNPTGIPLDLIENIYRATQGQGAKYNAWNTGTGIPGVGAGSTQTYNIAGQEIATTSKEDAQQKITAALAERYAQIASGKIKVEVQDDGKVTFKVGESGGMTTIAEALAALRAKASGQTQG